MNPHQRRGTLLAVALMGRVLLSAVAAHEDMGPLPAPDPQVEDAEERDQQAALLPGLEEEARGALGLRLLRLALEAEGRGLTHASVPSSGSSSIISIAPSPKSPSSGRGGSRPARAWASRRPSPKSSSRGKSWRLFRPKCSRKAWVVA